MSGTLWFDNNPCGDNISEAEFNLREDVLVCKEQIADIKAERDKLDEINERYETTLHEIKSWIKAYPLDIFPEPDFGEVNFALEEAGLSLSQVSASNMRHVLNGIDKIILRSEVTR